MVTASRGHDQAAQPPAQQVFEIGDFILVETELKRAVAELGYSVELALTGHKLGSGSFKRR